MPQLASGNVAVERSVLPDGILGVDTTVATMNRIAFGQYGSRSAKIRALAINILRKARVQEKDYYGEILAIHKYVRDQIRYLKDPINQETISHPEEMALNTKAGDCDDQTVLEMALLGSVGIKSWPVVVGQVPNKYSHVYLRASVPQGAKRKAGRVISLDPIMRDWAAGKEAPAHRIKARKEYPKQAEREMSGNIGDVWDNPVFSEGVTGGGLADYQVAPSYLDSDTAYEQVQNLLKMNSTPDVTPEGTIANGTQVTQELEGLDNFLAGGAIQDKGVITAPMGQGRGPTAESSFVQGRQLDESSFRSLYNKGPLTAAGAQGSVRPLRSVGVRKVPSTETEVISSTGKKTYHVPAAVAASRKRAGQSAVPTAARRGGKNTVSVADDGPGGACTPVVKVLDKGQPRFKKVRVAGTNIQAPVSVLAMRDPKDHQGRVVPMRDTSMVDGFTDNLPTIPMPTMAPSVLSKPIVQYGIAALGAFLIYTKMKRGF